MLDALGVSLKEFICALINFLILVGVLGKFLYKPILNMLDQRRETIRASMEQAEKTQQQVSEVHESLKKEIAEARSQSAAIVAEATRAGETAKEQIVAEAREQAKVILDNAKKEIAEEQEKALVELKREVAVMAAMCAAKMLSGEIDEQKQQELVGKYVGEVGQMQ